VFYFLRQTFSKPTKLLANKKQLHLLKDSMSEEGEIVMDTKISAATERKEKM